jgi:hypothetical protein
MANYFVYPGSGDDGNTGLTLDDPFNTVKFAGEKAGYSVGDRIWVRRGCTENVSNTVNFAWHDTNLFRGLVCLVGCPRNSLAGTADFTNGSATVENSSLTMSKLSHASRNLTAPDGKVYYIEYVTDAATFDLDRPYSGTTSVGGAFTIHADIDYSTFHAIDDSAWTVKIADWEADGDDITTINLGASYYLRLAASQKQGWGIRNLSITNGAGILTDTASARWELINVLHTQANNNVMAYCYKGSMIKMTNCIFQSTNAGGSAICFYIPTNGFFYGKNVSAWTPGNYVLMGEGYNTPYGYFENVNFGTRVASAVADIRVEGVGVFVFKNAKFGGTPPNGNQPTWASNYHHARVEIENYNKVLGDHRTYYDCVGAIKRNTGTGCNLRSGGGTSVIEVSAGFHDSTLGYRSNDSVSDLYTAFRIFELNIYVADVSVAKNYKFYVQSDTISLTSNQIWIEYEYVNAYDDSDKYGYTFGKSDESVTVRNDADDWTQYVETGNIQPATPGVVTIRMFTSAYHATNLIFADLVYDGFKGDTVWFLGKPYLAGAGGGAVPLINAGLLSC